MVQEILTMLQQNAALGVMFSGGRNIGYLQLKNPDDENTSSLVLMAQREIMERTTDGTALSGYQFGMTILSPSANTVQSTTDILYDMLDMMDVVTPAGNMTMMFDDWQDIGNGDENSDLNIRLVRFKAT